ncbi:hypothetical protein ATO11_13600 [Pseudaestuariivita atlantica]|uniref:Glycosyltransferase 2-like domain-containing protein n=2 Tax=Pseudaestuariivita atlantica TaxID=1317121 RepID=A0A0L1JN07_9RHOB|nr:hypothetical protein ATO11_13600 [Pseudaestuariivita atlantica]
MALYDGAQFLDDQLQSFAAQDHDVWDLTVGDDGSRDAGPDMVRAFAAAHPHHDVRLIDGPGQGPAANFLTMLAGVEGDPDWVALSDQDDVWLSDRLSHGIKALRGVTGPALYGSATWIVEADLSGQRRSPLFTRPPGFRNALVQSIAGGNTMLMNRAGWQLARDAAQEALAAGGPVTHDWWLYQLFAGAGARVVRDETPTLLYRQHGGNLFGTNKGLGATLLRVRQVLGGEMGDWTARNGRALHASAHRLTPGHRAVLEAFMDLRSKPAPERLRAFRDLDLYRQGRVDLVVLGLAALMGRL